MAKNQILLFMSLIGYGLYSVASSLPDYYEEPGFNLSRRYEVNSPNEVIDPLSGGLQRQYVDFVVPGNAGNDIAVQRYYRASSSAPGLVGHNYFQGHSVLGLNWDFHFGRIWHGSTFSGSGTACGTDNVRSGSNPILELPDGTRKELLDDETATGYGYVTQDLWIGICEAGNLTVVSPAGTRYTFDLYSPIDGESAWHATRVEDRFGNALTINYDVYVNTLIDEITASDGRTVSFEYDGINTAEPLLKEVKYNGSWRVRYFYKAVPSTSGASFLDRVERRDEGGDWEYEYYESTPSGGFGLLNLKKATAPTGLETVYDYKGIYFTTSRLNTVINSKSVSGADVESATWTYDYSPSTATRNYDITTVKSDNYCTIYEHRGAALATNGDVWRVGTLEEVRRYDHSNCSSFYLVETEIFDWGVVQVSDQDLGHRRSAAYDQNSYMPVLSKKTVIRDGDTFVTDYQSFDTYGNPRTIVESGPNAASRRTTITYQNFDDTNTWIIGSVDTRHVSGEGIVENNDYYTTGVRRGSLWRASVHGRQASIYDYYTSGSQRGALRKETNENGKTVTYSGYYRGVAESVSMPEGVSITRNVNSSGTVQWENNGRGKVTNYIYDYMNRLTDVLTPKSTDSNISISWSMGGRTRAVTRGSFSSVHKSNGYGNLIEVDVEGTKKRFEYNEEGYLTFESYPSTTTPVLGTTFDKDVLDRITTITNADNTTIVYDFNPPEGGNATSVLDERSKKMVYFYRSYGDPNERNVIKIQSPESITTDIGRDKLGNQTSVSQGGFTRTYNLDSKKLLDTEVHPETGTTDITMDDMGNVTYKKVGSASATNIVYDDLNRLEFINYPSGTPDVNFVYDGNNNIEDAINSNVNWSYVYDDNDNLESETAQVLSLSLELDYAYDSKDNLSSITYPNNLVIDYAPNDLGRPTKAGGFISSVSYHANGSPNVIAYGNGKSATYTPDTRFRVDTIVSPGIIDLDYSYDDAGNTKDLIDGINSSNNLLLGYDDANRLESASGPWGGGSIGYSVSGDIEYKNVGGVNLSYNYSQTNNRLTGITGTRSYSFGYDEYGNVTSNGTDTFLYNDASQLTNITSQNIQFAYDANNRRAIKYVNGSATRVYLYNQAGLLMYETDPYHDMQVVYVYLGSMMIAKQEYCGDQDNDGDGLGSCIEMALGLDAALSDTDGDGVNDRDEDSDSDGMSNLFEAHYDLDPTVDDSALDLDGDSLSNLEEYNLGTSPVSSDTDSDGLPDNWENTNGTNPTVNDVGNDNDEDRLTNIQEYQLGTAANNSDSDGDGIRDDYEDFDSDALNNFEEFINGTQFNDSDTDNDGMNDGYEVTNQLNPIVDDSTADADGDGLENIEEHNIGTDPQNADTDGDGVSDGDEVAAGTNPLFNVVTILPALLMILNN